MRLSYKGRFKDAARREHRLAEITFMESEEPDFERAAQVMSIKGWTFQPVTDGYAMCEVASREEFGMLASDWKTVKRSVALWKKHGI
jgi:hypothetical protein